MGWGSAGDIFNRVADGLIAANASDKIKENVLGDLIRSLEDKDWDTEFESLDLYKDDPAIVRAFAAHGVGLYGEDPAIDTAGIADALTANDNRFDDDRQGFWSLHAKNGVLYGSFAPEGDDENPVDDLAVHFRAVIELIPPPAESF